MGFQCFPDLRQDFRRIFLDNQVFQKAAFAHGFHVLSRPRAGQFPPKGHSIAPYVSFLLNIIARREPL